MPTLHNSKDNWEVSVMSMIAASRGGGFGLHATTRYHFALHHGVCVLSSRFLFFELAKEKQNDLHDLYTKTCANGVFWYGFYAHGCLHNVVHT